MQLRRQRQRTLSCVYSPTRLVLLVLCLAILIHYLDQASIVLISKPAIPDFIYSGLQELIVSMSTPTSVFNMSHATSHTDTTIYPPPADFVSPEEPETKKRKLSDNGVNGAASVAHTAGNVLGNARFTNSMHANKHLAQVYAALKKECEELVESIVCLVMISTCSHAEVLHRTKSSYGSICLCRSECLPQPFRLASDSLAQD